jgi:predicted amidophosphoribosyltransferase
MICAFCESTLPLITCPPAVCAVCEREIGIHVAGHNEVVHLSDVYIVFRYAGLVRELIGRAKIKNDPVALGFLLRFVRRHAAAKIIEFDSPDTLVCPAPASFWGRARGRFDVAEMLARDCFPQASLLSGRGPGGIFRQKRAGRNSEASPTKFNWIKTLLNSMDSNGPLCNIDAISSAKRILVVDDVMTSGFTMRTQIDQLKGLGAQSVYGLVIASPCRTE